MHTASKKFILIALKYDQRNHVQTIVYTHIHDRSHARTHLLQCMHAVSADYVINQIWVDFCLCVCVNKKRLANSTHNIL